MRRSIRAYSGGMSRDFSGIGHALAAPVRSTFLNLLMDGSTRPASELAASAGVSASTASEHLAVLLDAGLVSCLPRGRQRFYELADAGVASALEQLGHLCPPSPVVSYKQSVAARDLAHARLCYDHLAGRLGIALSTALTGNAWIDPELTALTPAGIRQLTERGIDVDALGRSRRPLVRPCADWTERRPHLGGAVGAAIARHLTEKEWIVRRPGGRGVDITGAGRAALGAVWNIDLPTSP